MREQTRYNNERIQNVMQFGKLWVILKDTTSSIDKRITFGKGIDWRDIS